MEDIGKEVGKEMAKLVRQRDALGQYEEMKSKVLADQDVQAFLAQHREKLTDADIEKSFPKLYEFVKEKAAFLRDGKSKIAPGYEPQLVLNFHYVDVTYVPTENLVNRRKNAEIRARVRAIDMPKDIQTATLEKYEQTGGRFDALVAAAEFVDRFTDQPKQFHKGLYLVGPFGVGKTYLLGAIAHRLASLGFISTLIHFPSFAVDMKQAIGKDTVGEKLEAVKKSPILMIDDIGADSMSAWIRDEVLGVILQYRMQEQLPTFFSSNFNFEQLEEHLTMTQKGDVEPMKAKRIMERIRFLTKEIKVDGENRRHN
jgi:primosomal protein DnaI